MSKTDFPWMVGLAIIILSICHGCAHCHKTVVETQIKKHAAEKAQQQ